MVPLCCGWREVLWLECCSAFLGELYRAVAFYSHTLSIKEFCCMKRKRFYPQQLEQPAYSHGRENKRFPRKLLLLLLLSSLQFFLLFFSHFFFVVILGSCSLPHTFVRSMSLVSMLLQFHVNFWLSPSLDPLFWCILCVPVQCAGWLKRSLNHSWISAWCLLEITTVYHFLDETDESVSIYMGTCAGEGKLISLLWGKHLGRNSTRTVQVLFFHESILIKRTIFSCRTIECTSCTRLNDILLFAWEQQKWVVQPVKTEQDCSSALGNSSVFRALCADNIFCFHGRLYRKGEEELSQDIWNNKERLSWIAVTKPREGFLAPEFMPAARLGQQEM